MFNIPSSDMYNELSEKELHWFLESLEESMRGVLFGIDNTLYEAQKAATEKIKTELKSRGLDA